VTAAVTAAPPAVVTSTADRIGPLGPETAAAGPPAASVTFVGGGPRTVSLLERLAASAPELLGDQPVRVHVVDPFPPGGGRIWRREQSPLLWMNSVAEDVTVYTDESVTCEGPVVPGPSLAQWLAGVGRQRLVQAGLGQEAVGLGAQDFAPRQVQAEYLRWAFERAVASLPAQVEVTVHRERAVSTRQRDGRHLTTLSSGAQVDSDLLVLAQGYLDQRPEPTEVALAEAAAAAGLTFVGQGYTADLDLSDLQPGETVLVRGFGLAFIDLMVLLGQGRGGWFEEGTDGCLTYHPCGREPVLYVGSRRGVPYHSKLGYAVADAVPVPPRFLTAQALAAIGDGTRPLSYATEVWPLVVKELTFAHYRRLFSAHPERTRGDWADVERLLTRSGPHHPDFRTAVEAAVPDARDRFVLDAVDRPLAGRQFADHADLSRHLVEYVSADLQRRADPSYSSDRAVFDTLLTVYAGIAAAVAAGRISEPDRVRRVEGEFHGLFSFLASGPPPRRLAELLALHRAGLLHFAGPDLRVSVHDGAFVGTSAAVRGEVRARAFVEARLPRVDVLATTDPLIRGLLGRGELAAREVSADDGTPLGGGQLLVDGRCRARRPDGSVHPTMFLLGPSVSGSAGAAGFSRPHFNGPGLRQNDAVARHLLTLLAATTTAGPHHRKDTTHHAH